MKLNRIFLTLFFLLSAHGFYKYAGVYTQLHKRPCSIHSWAQCERASIALNYYEEGMNFFKPKIHKILDGEGVTGLEFPFVNYSAAILYKIFGFKEFYYRTFVLLTIVFGLLLFTYLNYSITKNYLLSLGAVGSAYFSPVLIFYSANFLPDTTSLGFVLAAWYFFFNYLNGNKKRSFVAFFIFAVLAALIKITSLIVFCTLIGLIVLDYMKFFKKTHGEKGLIVKKNQLLAYCFLGIMIVMSWYKYASWLSEAYHSDAFLLQQKLVTNKAFAKEIWEYIKLMWVPQYYANETYVLITCVLIALLLGFKFVNRLLFTITFLTFIGSCFFVFLMFEQFRNHDYYIITLLPCVFLLLLTFIDFVTRVADNFFPPLKIIVFVILFFNGKECIDWCKENFTERYNAYTLSNVGNYKIYEDLEPKLRQLGIKKHDVVLSAFDGTFCNTLYLANQMGWTLNYDAEGPYIGWALKNWHLQYMILNDTALFNKKYPNNLRDKIIGYHRGLLIYKLK